MQVVTRISDMQSRADSFRRQGRTIGLVPTMGFLHEGHLSLMARARRDCDIVVASIFVNPAQFGPREDFDRYPRDESGDRQKCEAAGIDILFMPSAAEMYPEGPSVFVTVEGISDILEGAVRPGHFRGVATVVTKLFNTIKPHKAYFGQKDYQQCVVIGNLVKGLNMGVEMVVLPTVRERDGLAMSSRNSYLSADERRLAPLLHRALSAAERLAASGPRRPEELKREITAVLREEKGLVVEYVEIADPVTLQPAPDGAGALVIVIAARLGRTRLIDNILLPEKHQNE